MKLSVVIPAYNEEKRIGPAIGAVISYMRSRNLDFEFIFVDDGSTDKTVETIKNSLGGFSGFKILSHERNRGKGAAIKTGMLAADGDWVLFTDSDLSTPIEELDKFLRLAKEGYEVIAGSRKMPGAAVEKKQSFLRENLGKVFTVLSNIILGTNYSDFTCGFKLFEKSACKKIFSAQTIENWSYDSEILYLAKRYSLKFAHVPVRWINDPHTKVRLLKDIFGSLKGLFLIRLNEIRGIYGQK